MSGTLNILIASLGGGFEPVGLLAAIRDPRTILESSPRIVIKNDLLYVALTTGSPSFNFGTTVARLPLDLSTITWQTFVATTNASDYAQPAAVTVDGAGNVVVAGSIFVQSNNLTFPYVLKLNSSGAFQWHRYINQRGGFNAVTTDASDAIYPVGTGRYVFSTRDDIVVSKYDATGTRQFLRVLGDTATSTTASSFGNGVAILNSTNYCVASRVTPSSFDGCLWTLAQSDGTKVGAVLQNNLANTAQDGVAVIRGESADTLYYLVNTYDSGALSSKSTQVLLKFTTAGGFVWQRFLADNLTLTTIGAAMCMDPSSTHVYVVGRTFSADNTRDEVLVNKWTIDGTLVWQRSVTSPTQALLDPRIAVDSFDNVYITFRSVVHTNGQSGMILKVPGSGAGSGNFATIGGFRYNYNTTNRTASTDALTTADNPVGTQANSDAAITPGNTITAGVTTISVVPF
jgi:hypothetical protein